MGFTTNSFFLNASDVLIFGIYVVLMLPIASALAMFFHKNAYLTKFYANMRDNFVLGMYYITFTRLLFTALLNFRLFNFNTRSERLGSMGAYGYLIFTVVFVLFVFINTYLFYKAYKKKHDQAKLTFRWRKDKPDLELLEGGEPDPTDPAKIGEKVKAKANKGEAGAADKTNDQTLAAVPEGDSSDESGSDSEQSESEKSAEDRPITAKKKKKIRDLHGEKAKKRIAI